MNFYIPATNQDPLLSRQDAMDILNTPDQELDSLIQFAGNLRRKYKGRQVGIHLLTNARSGNCSQDCSYCAQSCHSHADIKTYSWIDDQKLYDNHAFVHNSHLSRHCIGFSGMKFTDEEIEILAEKIQRMKTDGPLLLHWLFNRKTSADFKKSRSGSHQSQSKYQPLLLS